MHFFRISARILITSWSALLLAGTTVQAQDPGDADPTFNAFDTPGYLSLDNTLGDDLGSDIAFDSLGRILVATCESIDNGGGVFWVPRVRRFSSDGVADTGFATSGARTIQASGRQGCRPQVAVDASNNVYAAVDYQVSGDDYDIRIEKLDSTGALLFGTHLMYDLGGSVQTDVLADIAVSADRLAVAGSAITSLGEFDFTVALYATADLSPVTSFDSDGKTRVAIDAGGDNNDTVQAVAFAGTKILLVGTSDGPNGQTFGSAARLLDSGVLDTNQSTGFGADQGGSRPGKTTYQYSDVSNNLSGDGRFFDVSILQDGTTFIAGTTTPFGLGTTEDFALIKLNANGVPTLGFGDFGWRLEGFAIPAQGSSDDTARFVDVDDYGNVLVGGLVASTTTTHRFVGVMQFDQDGVLDPDYQGGKLYFSIPGQLDQDAFAGRFAPDNDVVIVGEHLPASRADKDAFLLRLIGGQPEVFSDGFETGSFSAWSSSVP